jgi:hypothetical protein
MAGSFPASRRAAVAGPACLACRGGRCEEGLSLRGRRLTLTAGKRIPTLRRICSPAICGVYGRTRTAIAWDQLPRSACTGGAAGAVQLRRLARHRPGHPCLRAAVLVLGLPIRTPRPGPSQRGRHHLWMLPLGLRHRASAAPRAPPDPPCGCGPRAGSIHAEVAWSSRITAEREQPEHPPAGKEKC